MYNIVQQYFNSDPTATKRNCFCETYHLKSTADSLKDATFLVKKLPEEASEYVGRGFNMEVFIHTKFLAGLTSHLPTFDTSILPKHYFSVKNNIIVLEELAQEGYRSSDATELDELHMKAALVTIAKFHAGSLAYEEMKYGKLTDEYTELNRECLFEIENKPIKTLLTMINFLPEAHDFREKLLSYIKKIPGDAISSRFVTCLGNLTQQNILYQYKNGKPYQCKLVNFEFCCYAPPAYDVLFLIYRNTQDTRYLDKYLQFYYDCLRTELGLYQIHIDEILSYEEYDITSYYLLLQVKMVFALRRYFDFDLIYDVNGSLLNKLMKNKNWKIKMRKILEEIRDILFNPEINLGDCHKILTRKLLFKNYTLINYNLTPFAEKRGFLGEHGILHINILQKYECRSLSFFVKTLSKTESQRNFSLSSGFFYKEIRLFTRIIPKIEENGIKVIQNCTPRCYLTRLNEALVFQNLLEIGYKTLDQRSPLGYSSVAVIIKALAKLHGSFLILEEKLTTRAKTFRIGEQYKQEVAEPFYVKTENVVECLIPGRKAILTQIDLFINKSETNTQQLKIDALKAVDNLCENVQPSQKFRNTICHGDLWTNNIMIRFKEDVPVDCRFVDFQMYRYGPPAQDLMAFLYLTTNREFRAKYMEEIVDLYYLELQTVFEEYNIDINDIVTYCDFKESCNVFKKFAITQSVIFFHSIMLSSEEMQRLFSDPVQCKKVLFEDRCIFLKETCKNDLVYREKLFESITDLKDICQKV